MGETWAHTDERRARDAALARLEAAGRVEQGQEAQHDTFTFAVSARDRLYRSGSFTELERALNLLREQKPLLYSLVMRCVVYKDVEAGHRVQRQLRLVLVVLAHWMPEEIRVPVYLLPGDERLRKESLWRGRTPPHHQQRSDRNGEIVGKLGAGLSVAAVAAHYGLSRMHVYRSAASGLAGSPTGVVT